MDISAIMYIMTYNLFIDDIRSPEWHECQLSGCDASLDWMIARTSNEAKAIVEKYGMPARMALDHDLGLLDDNSVDDVMIFLRWLVNEYWNELDPVPATSIHSANPIGVQRIMSFMKSWEKVYAMDENHRDAKL